MDILSSSQFGDLLNKTLKESHPVCYAQPERICGVLLWVPGKVAFSSLTAWCLAYLQVALLEQEGWAKWPSEVSSDLSQSVTSAFCSRKASLLLGLSWWDPWRRLERYYFLFVALSMIIHPFDVNSKLTEATETFQRAGGLDHLAMQRDNFGWECIMYCLNRETKSSESHAFLPNFFINCITCPMKDRPRAISISLH